MNIKTRECEENFKENLMSSHREKRRDIASIQIQTRCSKKRIISEHELLITEIKIKLKGWKINQGYLPRSRTKTQRWTI